LKKEKDGKKKQYLNNLVQKFSAVCSKDQRIAIVNLFFCVFFDKIFYGASIIKATKISEHLTGENMFDIEFR